MSNWTYTSAGGAELYSLSSIASDSMNKKGTALDFNKFTKNLHKSVKEASDGVMAAHQLLPRGSRYGLTPKYRSR
ncbi:hypothetical protein ACFY2M_18125 [Streptomyces sp. NPDC001276]|uniref:hypothetical protein n=1 Tax=Streptomyces sp. NPDC001276 TaxID=3364555 RepID=UPI0036B547B2